MIAVDLAGNAPKRKRSANPTITCRYWQVDPSNTSNPRGVFGPAVSSASSQPTGTVLWRTCTSRADGRVVSGPALYTVRNGTDRQLAISQIVIPEPELSSSPDSSALPGMSTWLWSDNAVDQQVTATAGGVTVVAYSVLESTRFRINPSTEPGRASADDGVVVTCLGAPQAFPGTASADAAAAPCRHRFRGPGRDFTIEVTTTWRMGWFASDGTAGDLGTVDRTSVEPFSVRSAATRIGANRPGR